MTDQSSPITPPPELVIEWVNNHYGEKVRRDLGGVELNIATRAAQWGADQELEACCEWLDAELRTPYVAIRLRSDRRSKPPSLKEQALEVVTGLEKRWDLQCDLACLRRALEALPND
jgi:hypothetical protein